jgi:PAS domain S-box-containing protein
MSEKVTLQQQVMTLQEMLSVSERKSDILTNLLKEASTEFERSLERMKVSEANFRTIFENAPEAIFILDRQSLQILDCNPFTIAWLGYARDELLGTAYDKLVESQDPNLTGNIRALHSQGGVKIIDRRFRKKDGTLVDAEVTGTTVTYHGRAALMVLGRDITERKRAQEALVASEQRFRDIAAHLPDWIWETDQDWIYTYSSPGVEKILGYSPVEIVGTTMWHGMPEEDKDEMSALLFDIKEQSASFRLYENRRYHRNGTLVQLESSGVPILDWSGNVVGYRGSHRDVTSRKQLEEFSRYKELFENVTDPVFIMDFRGAFLEVNDVSVEIFGYSREELLQMRILNLVGPGQREVLLETGRKIQAGETIQFELDMKNRDSDIIPFEFHARPIIYKGQETVLSVGRNLSARKKLEQTLVMTERVAAVGEMASGIAHNFNNVLQMIGAAADAAVAKLAAGRMRDSLEAIHRIQEAYQRASEVVRRIKDFTHADLGPEEKHDAFDINKLVQEAIALTQPLWKNQPDNRKYEVKLISSGPRYVRGRPSEIYEVVVNLIKNALEAMPRGGRLTLTSSQKAGKVYLVVKDTGQGISPVNLPRLFEPFFTTKGVQSSGLGLASSYGIIKRHQGEIQVDTATNGGATFTVVLPRAAAPRKVEAVPSLHDQGGKIRFLMIDDEINLLKAMEMYFEGTDIEIVTCSSALEGIAAYQQGAFDVVLCDLGMNDLNGWEVARRLKSLNQERALPKTPFLLYTGWDRPFDPQTLEEHGVDRVVIKPVSCEKLLGLLQELAQPENLAQVSS